MPSAAQLPPPDLTVWSMFQSADIVVRAVMLGLIAASLVTWTIFLAKAIELAGVRRKLRQALRLAHGEQSLDALAARLGASGVRASASAFAAAAQAEMELSEALPVAGVKDRIAVRLHRLEAAFARRLSRGTGVLASIGSCAPFIGLFGTVWGIMNSFVGISRAQTTNLAVVAPGIAEALLATACGLVAAIPAVLVYNVFARVIAGDRALLGDLSAAVLGLASRQLDRLGAEPGEARRPVLMRAAAE